MAKRLVGKVSVVTGATRGIGRGIALTLAREGADVVVAGRTAQVKGYMPGTIYSVADEVRSLGRRALAVQVDVSQEEQVKDMVKKTIDEFGKIDILVNNAGIVLAVKPLWEVTKDEWERIIAVDLTGTFLCCKYVVPHMIKQKSGKIINMGSIQGRQGLRGQAAYGACKAAIHNFTLALAKDVAEYDINVNAVGPGAVKTYLMEALYSMSLADLGVVKDEVFEKIYETYSLFHREVTPEDIGNTVVFLASEEARNINGSVIYVEGGQPLKGE
jgi:NAD(P)-dependent dehydrogenase (short-subunit alcohol dehydrogenase family)